MLNEIIQDPIKLPMFIVLVVAEVAAIIFWIWAWKKAKRGAEE